MPYIGRGPAKSGAFRIIDDVSGSFNGSTTSFALTVGSAALTVGLPETLLIAVDGVLQEAGSAYTISGSNIVFTAAPQADATFWGVELGDVGGLADRATTQSASDDTTKVATTAFVQSVVTAEDLDVISDSGTIDIDLNSEALTIVGGEGIDTSATGITLTIAGEDASSGNKGIASFNSSHFSVSSGDVTVASTHGGSAHHAETHGIASHSNTSVTDAELNLLDGGTSVGSSITILDVDGFIVNDGGTMKTVPATDVKTYAGSNISCRAISYPNVQALTSNAYEEVILNGTDDFDVTNMHDPSTNNTRITFATAGTYLLIGHVIFAPSTGGIRNIEFMANGSTRFDQVQENNPTSGEEVKMVNTAIYTFASTNYVELRAKQNCGSNLNINTCEFSAIKILG